MNELRIGIVGSRRRNSYWDKRSVFDLVGKLLEEFPAKKIVVVSGGCPVGADRFARLAYDNFSLTHHGRIAYAEHPVQKWDGMTPWEYTQEAYRRNRGIAEDTAVGYALVHDDRTGGTENTVSNYHDLGKTCYLVSGNGHLYLDGEHIPDAPGNSQVEAPHDRWGDWLPT